MIAHTAADADYYHTALRSMKNGRLDEHATALCQIVKVEFFNGNRKFDQEWSRMCGILFDANERKITNDSLQRYVNDQAMAATHSMQKAKAEEAKAKKDAKKAAKAALKESGKSSKKGRKVPVGMWDDDEFIEFESCKKAAEYLIEKGFYKGSSSAHNVSITLSKAVRKLRNQKSSTVMVYDKLFQHIDNVSQKDEADEDENDESDNNDSSGDTSDDSSTTVSKQYERLGDSASVTAVSTSTLKTAAKRKRDSMNQELFNFISDNGERNIPESLMKSLVSFKLEDFDLLDESDVMQDTSIADSDKMFFKLCIRRYKQQKTK